MPRLPRLAALAALLVLAGCDAQDPPPRTNPYDPGFVGTAIPTAPGDLSLESATPTTATLSWTDRSSFETGIRVERLGRYGRYEVLATLPPDATCFIDTGLTGTEPRTYRVVALAAGTTESAPSASLRIRYPADTLDLGALDISQAQISPDGERVYVRENDGTRILSTRTGASLGRIPRTPPIIGFLADGRLAFSEFTPQPFTLGVRFFDGPVQQDLATLRYPEYGCYGLGESRTVSGDGRRVADICGDAVLVWTLPSDVPARYPLVLGQSYRLALSPDGSRLFAATRSSLAAIDAETGALVWGAQNLRDTSDGTPFALSSDGTVLAYAVDSRLRVVDPASGVVRVEGAVGRYDGVAAASASEILVKGYDETLGATVVGVLHTSDLTLVRTLPIGTLSRARLVPGALVSVFQADGRSLAVHLGFADAWEADAR